MKKVLILTLAISLIVAGIALATVVSSKHDMRPGAGNGTKASGATTSQVCVFCHHPHRGTSSVSASLLWNISDAAATYQTYAKTATITSIGIENPGDNVGAQDDTYSPSVYTLLCMGCHDGAGSANAFIRATVDGSLGVVPAIPSGNSANLGSTLSDDHPVDFVYPASAGDVQPNSGATVTGSLTQVVYPLFTNGAASNQYTMQCATCHDVHNGQSANVQFMRDKLSDGSTYAGGVIVNSKICIDCHTSK